MTEGDVNANVLVEGLRRAAAQIVLSDLL